MWVEAAGKQHFVYWNSSMPENYCSSDCSSEYEMLPSSSLVSPAAPLLGVEEFVNFTNAIPEELPWCPEAQDALFKRTADDYFSEATGEYTETARAAALRFTTMNCALAGKIGVGVFLFAWALVAGAATLGTMVSWGDWRDIPRILILLCVFFSIPATVVPSVGRTGLYDDTVPPLTYAAAGAAVFCGLAAFLVISTFAGVFSGKGYTAVHIAAAFFPSRLRTVLQSAEKGAENAEAEDLMRPLTLAVVNGHVEGVRELLRHGADPNQGPGQHVLLRAGRMLNGSAEARQIFVLLVEDERTDVTVHLDDGSGGLSGPTSALDLLLLCTSMPLRQRRDLQAKMEARGATTREERLRREQAKQQEDTERALEGVRRQQMADSRKMQQEAEERARKVARRVCARLPEEAAHAAIRSSIFDHLHARPAFQFHSGASATNALVTYLSSTIADLKAPPSSDAFAEEVQAAIEAWEEDVAAKDEAAAATARATAAAAAATAAAAGVGAGAAVAAAQPGAARTFAEAAGKTVGKEVGKEVGQEVLSFVTSLI